MKCPKCDSDIGDDSKFCKECGTNITSVEEFQPQFTKTLESPAIVLNQGKVLADRYEIHEKIGEGGMGEVYLAVDKNLDRQVAVKVLPSAFAEDAERLARFEREAKLLAVLNHTNIASIHGLEESEGQRFLVLELAEGETLKARLDRGPLDIDEALEFCHQITEGLEAAHEKGIIHRDLKPGNIMITPDGKVKILDFGLAKAFTGETTETGIDIEKSPTITAQMTKPGVVLGTAAYMSPEQARGHAVDKRTDIWAFGCVLYECLAGIRAFGGETVSDSMAHILKSEPDWTKIPSNTPIPTRMLLRRCLKKDPRKRLHDIADARIEMEEAETPPVVAGIDTQHLPWGLIVTISAVCILMGVVIGFIIKKPELRDISPVSVASVLKIEPSHSLSGMRRSEELNWPTRPAMTISNDGTFVVYCAVNDLAGPDGINQLFMRQLSRLEAEPISGTENGIAPFLSPDDRWVGFWADQKLKKVPIEGGMPQDLCDTIGPPFGATWCENETIVFVDAINSGLKFIPSQGGKKEILTEPVLEQGEYSHRLPAHLPSSKGILFTIMRTGFDIEPRIAVLESPSRKWRTILEDASDARYIPTGHLIFLRRGTLMAIAFDMQRLEVSGQPVTVIPGIVHMMNSTSSAMFTAVGQYSFGKSGSLIYMPGSILPDRKNMLVWVDHKGNEKPVSRQIKPYFAPRLSPDGKKIVYVTGIEGSILVYDIARDISTPLVIDGRAAWPLWTQDGHNIVFGWHNLGQEMGLYIQPADGSKKKEELILSQVKHHPSSFSPDGTLLAMMAIKDTADVSIFNLRENEESPFVEAEYWMNYPVFSPTGYWLAFCSAKEGQLEVYIRPSSGVGEEIKVSREGGRAPLWARSGKQIFYRSIDNTQMWVADIQTENGITASKPRLLFEREGLWDGAPIRSYDISLDDQLFLMVKMEDKTPPPVTEMILIQNWFEELKRLVPTGK